MKVVKPSSSEVEQYAECGVSANTRTIVKCKEILSYQRVCGDGGFYMFVGLSHK